MYGSVSGPGSSQDMTLLPGKPRTSTNQRFKRHLHHADCLHLLCPPRQPPLKFQWGFPLFHSPRCWSHSGKPRGGRHDHRQTKSSVDPEPTFWYGIPTELASLPFRRKYPPRADAQILALPPTPPRKPAVPTGILQRPTAISLLGNFGRVRLCILTRDVEIQDVAWRHSKELLGGNVAFRRGNARMSERNGKLFDRCVAFMGQPGKTPPQVMWPYLGVHLSGMGKNNVVDGPVR